DCEIAQTCRIDGSRYPVNRFSRQRIESLYCRNAREIAYLQSAAGTAALIMVGSCQVGSVRMVVDDAKPKQTGKSMEPRRFAAQHFDKGQEIGWFDFGSTVILLFEPGMITFTDSLKIGDEIRMGEKVGQFTVLR
ncbi:MAG: phosphatidylserine decarboxylase, partial [Negativicutes bacterium]|nr:phosphatidylserine decarboxylase [Negativicutes bacterium]